MLKWPDPGLNWPVYAAKGLQIWRYKAMIWGGFFFFIKSMKEIILPVPDSWTEASSVHILLNLLKCLQPSWQNRFKSAADTSQKACMAFTQDFPLKNTCKSYHGDVTSQSRVCCSHVHCEPWTLPAMQPKDCITCIPLGWTTTFLNCIGWYQHTCFIIAKSWISIERWMYFMSMSISDLALHVCECCEDGVWVRARVAHQWEDRT